MTHPTGDAMNAEADQLRAEIARLRDCFQMIVNETVCPEVFGDLWDKLSPPQQLHMTALLIARGALEGGMAYGVSEGSPHVRPRGHDEAKDRIKRCVNEIEIICDEFGYDPTEWLNPSRNDDFQSS